MMSISRCSLILAPLLLALPLAHNSATASTAAAAGVQADADVRLARVGYRLAAANSARCDQPQMMAGLILHDLASYDLKDRPQITRVFDLTTGFGVSAVVPGGAAERAGVNKGDEIVAVDEVQLAGFALEAIQRRGSPARVASFIAFLDGAMRSRAVRLTIRRHGEPVTLTLSGDPGCGGQFTVQPGNQFNAWADGQYVAVTSRLMASVADDDELAFVVAHEMSHNILHHRQRLENVSPMFAAFGFHASRVKQTEIEADTLAIELMANAGMDLQAPPRFLTQSAKVRWADLAVTHPSIGRRIEIVKTAALQLRPHQPDAVNLVQSTRPLVSPILVFASPVLAPTFSLMADDRSVTSAAGQMGMGGWKSRSELTTPRLVADYSPLRPTSQIVSIKSFPAICTNRSVELSKKAADAPQATDVSLPWSTALLTTILRTDLDTMLASPSCTLAGQG